MFTRLSIHSFIIYQFICTFIYLLTYLIIYVFIYHLFLYLFVYLFLNMIIFSYTCDYLLMYSYLSVHEIILCFFPLYYQYCNQSIGILIHISILGQVQGLLFIGIVLSHHRYVCTFLDKFLFPTKNSSFILFTSNLLSSLLVLPTSDQLCKLLKFLKNYF